MSKYQHFEELPVWQEAARLYNAVLDLFELHSSRFSPGFRNQLDRAALSVSNNIAEGFEHATTRELISFLAIARGSAGEVRSMIAVLSGRRRLESLLGEFRALRSLAESCARQLTAWLLSLENSPLQGKRHLNAVERERHDGAQAARDFRLAFLRGLKPDHPLYRSRDARLARGEPEEP